MADVFNRNPVDFVEMNDLFPVLNDKIGLTSTQWQKAIENTYYLKNHLGLADVEVGTVKTIFTEPAVLADVELTHREVMVDGKPIDYFDYTFYIPSPKIEATLTNQVVQDESNVGMELTQTPIYGTGAFSDHIIGYKFDFLAKIMGSQNLDNYLEKSKKITLGSGKSEITVDTNANASSSSNRFYVSSSQVNMPNQNDAFEFEVNNSGVHFGYGVKGAVSKQKLASEEYVNNAIENINVSGGASYPYLKDTGIAMTDTQNISITTGDPTYTITTEVSSFGTTVTYQEKNAETQEVTFDVMAYTSAEGVGIGDNLTNGIAGLVVANDPDNNQVGGAVLMQNGDNLVQLTAGENNTLLVNGQQIGGSKLYQHVIQCTVYSDWCKLMPIITNSSTTFTKEILVNWLTENGYVNGNKSLPLTVLSTYNGKSAIFNGVYVYNGDVYTSLNNIVATSTFNTEDNTINTTINFGYMGNYRLVNFTDTVTEL